MDDLQSNEFVYLRLAVLTDREMLFTWRNDDWFVSLSSQGRTVDWEEHCAWFDRVLRMEQSLQYIIELDVVGSIGCLRFDREGDTYAGISISILPKHTGKGFGVQAIIEGCRLAFSRWKSLQEIHALVRHTNERSVRAFSKAGFVVMGEGERQGGEYLMKLTREIFEEIH